MKTTTLKISIFICFWANVVFAQPSISPAIFDPDTLRLQINNSSVSMGATRCPIFLVNQSHLLVDSVAFTITITSGLDIYSAITFDLGDAIPSWSKNIVEVSQGVYSVNLKKNSDGLGLGSKNILWLTLNVAPSAQIGQTSTLALSSINLFGSDRIGYQPVSSPTAIFTVAIKSKVIVGDVDGDGDVLIKDAQALQTAIINSPEDQVSDRGQLIRLSVADVNKDGHINSYDVGLITKFASGYINKLPFVDDSIEADDTAKSIIWQMPGKSKSVNTIRYEIKGISLKGLIAADLYFKLDTSLINMATFAIAATSVIKASGWHLEPSVLTLPVKDKIGIMHISVVWPTEIEYHGALVLATLDITCKPGQSPDALKRVLTLNKLIANQHYSAMRGDSALFPVVDPGLNAPSSVITKSTRTLSSDFAKIFGSRLCFSGSLDKASNISIISTNGRAVSAISFPKSSQMYSYALPSLGCGAYFVKISQGNRTQNLTFSVYH